jgi:hypothetical protein
MSAVVKLLQQRHHIQQIFKSPDLRGLGLAHLRIMPDDLAKRKGAILC